METPLKVVLFIVTFIVLLGTVIAAPPKHTLEHYVEYTATDVVCNENSCVFDATTVIDTVEYRDLENNYVSYPVREGQIMYRHCFYRGNEGSIRCYKTLKTSKNDIHNIPFTKAKAEYESKYGN